MNSLPKYVVSSTLADPQGENTTVIGFGVFPGLLGAGANFGIETAFEFRPHPLADPVMHGPAIRPVERAKALAERYTATRSTSGLR